MYIIQRELLNTDYSHIDVLESFIATNPIDLNEKRNSDLIKIKCFFDKNHGFPVYKICNCFYFIVG